MALTYSSHASFEEVVAHYNDITPLRGSTNAGKDIRPIGDRNRKWERIVKISANCYALSDGYHMGDEHFPAYMPTHPATLEDMEKYAPIVWRKKRDGTTEVTLRNGYGPYAHNSRYAFLYRHTPKDIWFRIRNGKQFLEHGSTNYYLAKTRTAPKAVYAEAQRAKALPSAHLYQRRAAAWARAHADNSAVVFRTNEHGGLDHVEGTGQDLALAKGPTVNKEAKAKYKDDIRKFFEWGMTMSPMLPLHDNQYKKDNAHALREYANHTLSTWETLRLKPAIARQIVCDEQSPARLPLWVEFATNCTDNSWGMNLEYYTQTVKTKEDLSRVRSRFNAFINRQLGFITEGKK